MTKRSHPRRLLAAGTVAIVLGALASTASAASATTSAAFTRPAGITAAPLAVSCNYSYNPNQSFTFGGATFQGFEYAGHYSGLTTVPSTTKVTSSGEEAQCLLALAGYNPGTIDGVFGSHSQAAMHRFQTDMNSYFGAGLATGPGEDLPGPNSWKWLRWWG